MFGFVGDIIESAGDALGGMGKSLGINSLSKGNLFTAAGTAIGAYFGMPQLGASLGTAAGNMLKGGSVLTSPNEQSVLGGRQISRNIAKNSMPQAQPKGDAVGPSAPKAADPAEIHARWEARMVALLKSVGN